MITAAERVSVVTVEANPRADTASSQELTSLPVSPSGVQRLNSSIWIRAADRKPGTILDQALLVGADLIVMGGYGRPRLSELVFGGVTREMLHTAKVPVLMSH